MVGGSFYILIYVSVDISHTKKYNRKDITTTIKNLGDLKWTAG